MFNKKGTECLTVGVYLFNVMIGVCMQHKEPLEAARVICSPQKGHEAGRCFMNQSVNSERVRQKRSRVQYSTEINVQSLLQNWPAICILHM